MKKLITTLSLFTVIVISALSQSDMNKFEMIVHNSNSNIQLYGYNSWIDYTNLGNWVTVVDDKAYTSTTLEQALQFFFITKLKRVREFSIGNNQDTLLQVIYIPERDEYNVIVRNNYNDIYTFNQFYDVNDLSGINWPPKSVRGMVIEFLIECVREGILYYD